MLNYFLSMLMLAFAIVSIIAGVFTTYFGYGKSKYIVVILISVGLLVFIMSLWDAGVLNIGFVPDIMNFTGIVLNSAVTVVGGAIGSLIALGIFLLMIMKT